MWTSRRMITMHLKEKYGYRKHLSYIVVSKGSEVVRQAMQSQNITLCTEIETIQAHIMDVWGCRRQRVYLDCAADSHIHVA